MRPALESDLPTISDIYAHYVLHTVATFEEIPPDLATWHRRLAQHRVDGLPLLVADLDGRVLGYAVASMWRPRSAYRYTVEDSVYLRSDALGRGVGGQLLAALIEICAQSGKHQMIAVVAEPNPASVALHQAHGFQVTGRLPHVGYKQGRWVDTTLLQRTLEPTPQIALP
ncbi:MAG: GNAT family N-acetyltransferase [Sulfobacillus sp.]